MDIWAWVMETTRELRSRGEHRLARIIDQLPSLVCDGHHEQAEALAPEGVELARRIDHPWVEVFLRHWLAQSRILHRRDVTTGMDEVIRLLDFAHGERTRQCPQSVCVAQDVCSAYDVLDGPGYGEERLAVSAETLARINPNWSCFECISGEYASALLDLGRFADCETFCREQADKYRNANRGSQPQIVLSLADALSRQGRHAEALKLLAGQSARHMGTAEKRRWQLHRSRELAIAGKPDEALEAHLPSKGLDPADFHLWTRSEQALAKHDPARNDAAFRRTLQGFIRTLKANGALFDQAEIMVIAVRCALAAGHAELARLHLQALEELWPKLRRPDSLVAERAELQRDLAAMKPRVFASVEEVLAQLGEDAEWNLDILAPAWAASPDREALVVALCGAWRTLGFEDRAVLTLKQFVLTHPDAPEAFGELLRVLVDARDEAELRSLAASAAADQRARVNFYLGRLYVVQKRWELAAGCFEAALAIDPDRSVTRSNLAEVYRNLGRLEESLALLDDLLRDEPDNTDHWERMVVGTLLGRHDKVRESAAALGYQFSGEGPIDDAYAWCDVRLADANGREKDHRAERMSPVTARILALQAPGDPCFYRDEVVIEPVVVNPREEPRPADGEPDDYIPSFRAIKVLRKGGFRVYDLDGVFPTDVDMETLQRSMDELGVHLSVRSDERYQLTLEPEQPTVRGLYAYLAVPEGVTTAALHEKLIGAVAAWTTPLTYRGILGELGLEDELARHQAIADRLQL
jgi:tetratricopeptide (TPR) repeat protein